MGHKGVGPSSQPGRRPSKGRPRWLSSRLGCDMRPCCYAVRKIEFRLHHLGPLETLSTHDVIVDPLLILLIAMVPQRIQARRTRPSLARSPGVAPQAPDWALEA